MTSLYIDYRERALGDACSALGIKFEWRNLINGDIHVGDGWVLERKTMSDLRGSIVDGRFEEQRARLRQLIVDMGGNVRVGYLIEGVPDAYTLSGGLAAAMASISMEFAVFVSDSPRTSALQLDKLCRGQNGNVSCTSARLAQAVPKMRTSQIDPKNILAAVLSMVPGVGAKTAADISLGYVSIVDFVNRGCKIPEYGTSGRKLSVKICTEVARVFGSNL